MPVLKLNKRKVEKLLIGAYMPTWITSYITLYALAKGTTKSEIIRTNIENWITVQREKETDDQLLLVLKKRVMTQWEHMQIDMSAKEFKELVMNDDFKYLPQTYIDLILKDIRDGA